jgi:hypothetical protein
MSTVTILVLAMVVTIFATITLASVSYGAFKLRERRAPRAALGPAEEVHFFERVRLSGVDPAG